MSAIAYAALWIYVFSVPWENIIVIPGIGALSRLMGIVAVAFAMLAVVMTGRLRRWHMAHVAALVFLLWATAGQLFFVADRLSFKFFTFTQLFLVMWMSWQLAQSRERQLGLLAAFVSGAYVVAFKTIMVYRSNDGSLRRFAAEGFDANDLAMTLALALPMAWYLGMTYRRPLARWFVRAYIPLGLLTIGLTGSRGGLIAAVIALAIVPLTMTNLSPAKLVATLLLAGVTGTVAVAYIPQTTLDRLATTGAEIQDRRFNGRWRLWVAGVEAFSERPITGYGTGSFKKTARRWLGAGTQVAHNSYLSLLVEQGLIGFAIYATMFIAVFLAVLDLPVIDRRFTLVLMATLAIAMFPLSWEDHKVVWFLLSFLLGFAKSQPVGLVPTAPSPVPQPTRMPRSARGPRLSERPTVSMRNNPQRHTP